MANTIDERDLNPAEQLLARERDASSGLASVNSDNIAQSEQDKGSESTDPNDKFTYKRTKKDKPSGSFQRKAATTGPRKIAGKLAGSLRGRLGIMGLLTTFGLGGGMLVAFFGPASMFINLSQNFRLNNDSSSTVLERRLFKVLNSAMSADSAELCASGNKIRCKQGRIGNNVLRKMAKNGIVPVRDRVPMNPGRTGFAKQNPTHFQIEKNGRPIFVAIKDMPGFLSQPDNRALMGKVYGTRGAINMQVRAWYGNHINKRFFSKLKISRNGGLVSRAMKSMGASERMNTVKNRLPKLSGAADGVISGVSDKVSNKISKAGRAGSVYAVAYGGCVALKAPKYIAAGVAAIELMSLVGIVNDFVQGPGTAAQMQGVDDSIEFSPEDASAVGSILTETTPRESDGKQTSALDSRYLLTALGVSSTKLPLSSFVPGSGIMGNKKLNMASEADELLKPGCNTIMNPITMYTMMGVDAAATVALSATVVGGLIKLAGSWAISTVASMAGGYIVGEAAKAAITSLANTDAIDSATGEKLGDAIGIGATAFFASGGMSRLIPALSTKGVLAFNEIKRDQEQFQREADIALLSPFDTSSRHTFLGSIVHNLNMGMLANGTFNNSAASIIANIIRLPATALSFSKTANADTAISAELCGYAKDFDFQTDDPNTEPGINMAGMPCTGITPEMDAMGSDEAIGILSDAEWIDEDIDIPDNATIDELVTSGFIVKGTPMTDFIEECGDPSTGDFVFNAPACVISEESQGGDDSSANSKLNELELRCEMVEDEQGEKSVCYSDESTEISGEAPTTRLMSAAVVFLIDFQVSSILSGEDDKEEGVVQTGDSGSTANLPPAEGKIVSPVPEGASARISAGYGTYPTMSCTQNGVYYGPGKCPHPGVDFAGSGWMIRSICDGVVDKIDDNGDRNGAKTNYIWIKCDGSGIYTGYAHYFRRTVPDYIKVGAAVTAGTPIAEVGNQGNSSGSHLHFQINPKRYGSGTYNFTETINPMCYLKSQGVEMKYSTPKGHRGC